MTPYALVNMGMIRPLYGDCGIQEMQQCQKALNVSLLAHSGTVSGSCTYWGKNKRITNKLATDGSVPKFVGPEPCLGVSMQNIKRKIKS